MEEVREMMGNHPVYISFDIDALDPSFAPGTGMNIKKCEMYKPLLGKKVAPYFILLETGQSYLSLHKHLFSETGRE